MNIDGYEDPPFPQIEGDQEKVILCIQKLTDENYEKLKKIVQKCMTGKNPLDRKVVIPVSQKKGAIPFSEIDELLNSSDGVSGNILFYPLGMLDRIQITPLGLLSMTTENDPNKFPVKVKEWLLENFGEKKCAD